MGQLTVLHVLYSMPLGLDPRAFVIQWFPKWQLLGKRGSMDEKDRERDHAAQRFGQSPSELIS